MPTTFTPPKKGSASRAAIQDHILSTIDIEDTRSYGHRRDPLPSTGSPTDKHRRDHAARSAAIRSGFVLETPDDHARFARDLCPVRVGQPRSASRRDRVVQRRRRESVRQRFGRRTRQMRSMRHMRTGRLRGRARRPFAQADEVCPSYARRACGVSGRPYGRQPWAQVAECQAAASAGNACRTARYHGVGASVVTVIVRLSPAAAEGPGRVTPAASGFYGSVGARG